MKFNPHSNLVGVHALFSPSQYHWINYDKEKLVSRYRGLKAIEEGTELHEIASELIRHGIRLPKTRKTLNMYVNDGIGFKMTTEQPLVYSDNFFGTCDAITFNDKNNFLRIHDLKTGVTPAHMEQLRIYAALFCLEYNFQPKDLTMELRLYQSDEVLIENPGVEEIVPIMDTIVTFDKILQEIKAGE